MKLTGLALFLSLIMSVMACADDAALRPVITRSLAFLSQEGTRWMEEKSCNSCHHVPLQLWSHREAQQRGFSIDQAAFNEWLAWADQHAADKKPGLEEAALMILAMPERDATKLIKLIKDEQQADGSWKPAGQFATMQKRGAPDAMANAVRLHLIAAGASCEPMMTKAAAQLQKKDAPTSTESLVFRIEHARTLGKPEEAASLIKTLLQQQRGDGGWSSFIGENMSDPLATGQVLWALREAADSAAIKAVARAQAWLGKTQQPDGSWALDITHVSKVDRSAPEKAKSFKDATAIYHYWGTAWATIGLLQGVPVQDKLAK